MYNFRVNKITDWIKANKLSTILIVVVAYFLLRNNSLTHKSYNSMNTAFPGVVSESAGFGGNFGISADMAMPEMQRIAPTEPYSPQPDVSDRRVVTESSVSLVVESVRASLDQIQGKAEEVGGYMVNTNLSSPGESANGWITIRIPATEMSSFLEYLRTNSVKVVNESISGRDVTDQYIDIEERLRTLTKTKTIFEGILDSATDVDEIIRVQDRILSVQSQIESLQGQLQRLDATSTTTLISINLSTDEYSLPYAPDEPWRPEVVFKLAVRELVGTLRGLASQAIWLAVYSVIWVPALTLFLLVKKWWHNRNQTQKQ